MKKIVTILALVFFCVTLFAQPSDWAGFNRYKDANKTEQKGAKAVFIGNSITDGWASQRADFFKQNNLIGRGIGGQVTSQMLVRFRNDVIDLQPQSVVILAGTNDIAMNNGYIAVENIMDNIISMVEISKADKIKVILCSVLPVYKYPWREEVEAVGQIKELNSMIKEYALQNKIPYVDYYDAMKDEKCGLPEKYAKDGVHPTAEGYQVMEALVLPVINKITK